MSITPLSRRSSLGLFAAGLAFLVLGLTQHHRSAFIAVGVAFMVLGLVRNRARRSGEVG